MGLQSCSYLHNFRPVVNNNNNKNLKRLLTKIIKSEKYQLSKLIKALKRKSLNPKKERQMSGLMTRRMPLRVSNNKLIWK